MRISRTLRSVAALLVCTVLSACGGGPSVTSAEPAPPRATPSPGATASPERRAPSPALGTASPTGPAGPDVTDVAARPVERGFSVSLHAVDVRRRSTGERVPIEVTGIDSGRLSLLGE